MKALLVYDGGTEVYVPEVMGVAREDQLIGTAAERLSEVCGRICYDSLGSGRGSSSYHQHIQEVGHFSVYEHFNFTVELSALTREAILSYLAVFINRPGMWLEPNFDDLTLRVTLNPRCILDWDMWTLLWAPEHLAKDLKQTLMSLAAFHMPQVERLQKGYMLPARIADPQSDEECWISMYMSGSRGFSHEQVRHGDRSAISQRSTRYVDESESDWVEHPLLTQFLESNYDFAPDLYQICAIAKQWAKDAYRKIAKTLEGTMVDAGVDKTSARKQARGAARGFLGNALQTDMIFSASVGQWKRMLLQRASKFADAEIRVIYNQVLPELKRSRYGDRFSQYELAPSPDGIGSCLKE